MYASYKAIGSANKEDDTQWLMYWVIFGIFTVFESISDYSLYWVPFYYELKLGFLISLQIRSLNIAPFLFRNFVQPTFAKYESRIDKFIADINKDGLGAISKLVAEVTKKDVNTKEGSSSEGIKRRMVKPGESDKEPDVKKDQ